MIYFTNLISIRFVVEIPHNVTIGARKLWCDVNCAQFGNWLQSTADEANRDANNNFLLFSAKAANQPLKFLYHETESHVSKSNIIFLPALPNRETKSYADIQHILELFRLNYIVPFNRFFAVIGGDFQVWDRLFQLHRNNPVMYHWFIPVPGEWHWLWHILIAIYKTFYKTILLPFSQIIGFRSLDLKAVNFHYAEDLLQMVTIAIHKWIVACMQHFPHMTMIQWLHHIKPNRVAYETAYACVHYFIPYWITRSAIKWNKFEDSHKWWRYWTHVFLATGKRNYCLMSIRYLLVIKLLHPEVRDLFNQHRVVSFSGDAGTGIPLDGVSELVSYTLHLWFVLANITLQINLHMKTMNSRTRASEDKLEWTSEALNVAMPLYMDVQGMQVKSKETQQTFVGGTLRDADQLFQYICNNLTVTPTNIQRWRTFYWYRIEPTDNTKKIKPPSNNLEKAWGDVVDVYLRHQTIWDNVNEAVEVDDPDSDDDIEFEELDLFDM